MFARMHLIITPFYAGLLTLIYLALTLIVIFGRYRYRAALGDSQQFEFTRRIRAHANFIEYAPLFLILLAFAEIQNTNAYTIHVLGIVFLIARLCHAYSLIRAERYIDGKIQAYPYWRAVGMLGTVSPIAMLAVIVVINFLTHIN